MGLDDQERDCERPRCVVIGAGPAGLTAAYELSGNGVNAVVLEQDDIVGGISRTVEHNGYRFDIGGHRFFSKVPLVNQWWTGILGDDFQPRSRLSRIYYNGKFFDYPLRPSNCQRRSKNASAGRGNNASVDADGRLRWRGLLAFGDQAWGISLG